MGAKRPSQTYDESEAYNAEVPWSPGGLAYRQRRAGRSLGKSCLTERGCRRDGHTQLGQRIPQPAGRCEPANHPRSPTLEGFLGRGIDNRAILCVQIDHLTDRAFIYSLTWGAELIQVNV